MNIYAYDFSKKPNSTAVPSGTGTTITVRLKDNTSKFYPTFELTGAFPGYSYIKWDSRYYFVDDIIQISAGIYDMKCSIDVMATWRSDILATNTFVNRSASSYSTMVKDPEVGNTQNIVNNTWIDTDMSSFLSGTGCYVLRVASGNSNAVGGISTYILTKGEIESVLNFMTSNDVWDAAWDSVIKTIFNPFQYLLSLKWCALDWTTMITNRPTAKVRFGWNWSTSGVYPVANLGEYTFVKSINKPTPYYNDFRKYDPSFSRYHLFIPGAGMYEIPASDIDAFDQLECTFDILTMKAVWYARDYESGKVLYRFEGVLGAEIQLSQTTHSMISTMGAASQMAMAGALGSPVGMVTALLGGIASIGQQNPSTIGSNGSVGDLMHNTDVFMTQTNFGSTGYPVNYGRMLNQNATLSTLSGFTKCPEASIDCNAPEGLKSKINNYMRNGFYIE